ncbi:MAG: hemerythrin [Desulfuromonas sp.]|nr:MAG: hemerythrin [Desulfuromonas sp.]
MTFVAWDNALLVHVDPFDEHHKHLIQLINETHEKFQNKELGSELGKLFEELIAYTSYHLAAEEEWLEQQQYPDLEAHRTEHAYFLRRIEELHREFLAGDVFLGLEVITFMKSWIINHIAKTDAEYGQFASANNR